MTEPALPLAMFYRGWGRYQRNLVNMLAPLTDAQLALPVPAHSWPIGLVAQHMVADRVWWFQLWMGAGDPALAPIMHWDPADSVEQSALNSAELVAGLESSWQMIQTALEGWTSADLDDVIHPPAALSVQERERFPPFSREWIIWHVFEHEIHHGGELSVALGQQELPGIYGRL